MTRQNICNSFLDHKLDRKTCNLNRQRQPVHEITSQHAGDETVLSRDAHEIVENHLGYLGNIVLLAKYRGST